MLRSFLVALQFLTVIPVRVSGEIEPRTMGRAAAWFPVVGLALGVLLALADIGARALLPSPLSASLLLALWVALSGALHLDGFIDCCDGLMVARSPEQRLEILRDSHVGAFAVVGAVCLLLVKHAALVDLPAQQRMAVIAVIPALTRAAMVYAARANPYARPGPSLGRFFHESLQWRHVLVAGALSVAAAALSLGLAGVGLAVWVWLMTVAIAAAVRRRIPGLTGDVYGAINEMTEVGALVFVLVVDKLR